MKNTAIEWADHTFNIAIGCMKVDEMCKNCYAEAMDKRFSKEKHWGPGSSRRMMSESYWKQLYKWNEQAKNNGLPDRVFCSSMADFFEDHPDLVEPRNRYFKIIEETPWLIHMILTKRPENIFSFVPKRWLTSFHPLNVWMGVSAGTQESFNERVSKLQSEARLMSFDVLFVSMEPLLETVDVSSLALPQTYNEGEQYEITFPGIDWIIAGGESGPKARPMNPESIFSIKNQCQDFKIPFFFKQWGAYGMDQNEKMIRMGKKRSGNLLNGQVFQELPKQYDEYYKYLLLKESGVKEF